MTGLSLQVDVFVPVQEQMTWEDFQAQLRNPHLQQLFEALDVDDACP